MIRHQDLRGEILVTRWGEIKLDPVGRPTNLPELNLSEQELLERRSYGFLDEDTFPNPWIEETYGDKAYRKLIEELLNNGAPTNGGWIEMSFLLEKLRERGMPIISASKRKQLQGFPRD
jgi:hypothetical protein